LNKEKACKDGSQLAPSHPAQWQNLQHHGCDGCGSQAATSVAMSAAVKPAKPGVLWRRAEWHAKLCSCTYRSSPTSEPAPELKIGFELLEPFAKPRARSASSSPMLMLGTP
jgi:hypothetical protein